MKKFSVMLVLVLVVFGAAIFALAADEGVSYTVPNPMSGSADDYWTQDRMRKAKPYPLPALEGKPDSALVPQPQNTGKPGATKAGRPGESSDGAEELSAEELKAGDMTEMEPMANGYDYPAPFNTYPVPKNLYGTDSTFWPYSAVGKIFFTKHGGGDYVCSGSSIGSRAVLTAGHCVSDGAGHFHTNWVFVPAYKNGAAPYGKWKADWFKTSSSWHNKSNFSRDVGVATVTKLKGKKLSQVVGWLGFAWNHPPVQHWNTFGYPARSPYNGELMYSTQASYASQDISMNPDSIGIGNAQTPGCSGGPWIFKFGSGYFANGVNSYLYDTQPYQIYSPYFDTWVKTNLKDVAVKR